MILITSTVSTGFMMTAAATTTDNNTTHNCPNTMKNVLMLFNKKL
jgi:hypothetical protein